MIKVAPADASLTRWAGQALAISESWTPFLLDTQMPATAVILDRQVRHGHEHDARHGIDSIGLMEPCAEADPCTVEAVTREWPAAAQHGAAVVADHPANRGEHSGVALIRVGKHRAGGRCGHVAGEHVAPRADRRAPPGAAVDCRDPLHDVYHVCDRRLPSTER